MKISGLLVAALALNVAVVYADQWDTNGFIRVKNVDCPWYKASLFTAHLNPDYDNKCYAYASLTSIIREGEEKKFTLPFGPTGSCTYTIAGSVDDIPTHIGKDHTVTFQKIYSGKCMATVTN